LSVKQLLQKDKSQIMTIAVQQCLSSRFIGYLAEISQLTIEEVGKFLSDVCLCLGMGWSPTTVYGTHGDMLLSRYRAMDETSFAHVRARLDIGQRPVVSNGTWSFHEPLTKVAAMESMFTSISCSSLAHPHIKPSFDDDLFRARAEEMTRNIGLPRKFNKAKRKYGKCERACVFMRVFCMRSLLYFASLCDRRECVVCCRLYVRVLTGLAPSPVR
jgi:hypothetical protein